jgi:hypothetical protein
MPPTHKVFVVDITTKCFAKTLETTTPPNTTHTYMDGWSTQMRTNDLR